MHALLGTRTFRRILPLLGECRERQHVCVKNYHPTAGVSNVLNGLGWITLELTRTMSRLTILYKMSRELNDIDINNYLYDLRNSAEP